MIAPQPTLADARRIARNAEKLARSDADYVMRWLLQTNAPQGILGLQRRVLMTFGWPTHGRHCSCSACAREDWTSITAPCGMHGDACPARYQPYTPGQVVA